MRESTFVVAFFVASFASSSSSSKPQTYDFDTFTLGVVGGPDQWMNFHFSPVVTIPYMLGSSLLRSLRLRFPNNFCEIMEKVVDC